MTEKKNQDWKEASEVDNELLSAEDLLTQVISVKGRATLSHVGYATIVNRKGGISVTELQYKETDEGILVWGCGKNENDEQRWACNMQPRSTDPNDDPCFDWAKAFSGFQRNLFKVLN